MKMLWCLFIHSRYLTYLPVCDTILLYFNTTVCKRNVCYIDSRLVSSLTVNTACYYSSKITNLFLAIPFPQIIWTASIFMFFYAFKVSFYTTSSIMHFSI